MHHEKDPLNGIKLSMMLERLVSDIGYKALGERIPVNCFMNNPSIKSSLKFLRKNPRAREKVEQLYVRKYVD